VVVSGRWGERMAFRIAPELDDRNRPALKNALFVERHGKIQLKQRPNTKSAHTE
jgi:hypothetical protein